MAKNITLNTHYKKTGITLTLIPLIPPEKLADLPAIKASRITGGRVFTATNNTTLYIYITNHQKDTDGFAHNPSLCCCW